MNNLSRVNLLCLGSTTNLSLSVNYIKSKFSEFSSNRTGGKFEPNLGKQPGRCRFRAFITNEARMPQGEIEIEQVQMGSLHCLRCVFPLLVIFFFFFTSQIIQLMLCSISALVIHLLTWFDVWSGGRRHTYKRTRTNPANNGRSTGIFTSLVDLAGILLNNRKFLA